ncbi:MAG TPA: hypothetical protein VIM88_00965 [Sulfurovum sp.]|uniref:hypothetical protein n=1 Tax=Sulfurovum sp. TaxID=1969726 RepID=UPI002F944F14
MKEKLLILFLLNIITLVGIYLFFFFIIVISNSYENMIAYFLAPLVSMAWTSPIILWILSLVFFYDYAYCTKKTSRRLLGEIFGVSLVAFIILYIQSRLSDTYFTLIEAIVIVIFVFGLTQYAKYVIINKFCSKFNSNKKEGFGLAFIFIPIITYFIYKII